MSESKLHRLQRCRVGAVAIAYDIVTVERKHFFVFRVKPPERVGVEVEFHFCFHKYTNKTLLTACLQGSFLFWAKELVLFWLMGSNQPGRRGHPRLGFSAASVFAIMLLLKFLSCEASNVEKFS